MDGPYQIAAWKVSRTKTRNEHAEGGESHGSSLIHHTLYSSYRVIARLALQFGVGILSEQRRRPHSVNFVCSFTTWRILTVTRRLC